MNIGAFGENFPYSNFHDLNMDWIIKIAKDFLDQYTSIQQIISDGETSLTNLTETGLQQLQDKATLLENALQAWYNQHSQDISNELASALTSLTNALNTSIANFNVAAETKSAQLLASWPADYQELVTGFDELNRAFSRYSDFEPVAIPITYYGANSDIRLIDFNIVQTVAPTSHWGIFYYNFISKIKCNYLQNKYVLLAYGTYVNNGYRGLALCLESGTNYGKMVLFEPENFHFDSTAISGIPSFDITQLFIVSFRDGTFAMSDGTNSFLLDISDRQDIVTYEMKYCLGGISSSYYSNNTILQTIYPEGYSAGIDTVNTVIKNTAGNSVELSKEINPFPYTKLYEGGAIDTNNEIVSHPSFGYTDYIEVPEWANHLLFLNQVTVSGGQYSLQNYEFATYDASKNFIRTFNGDTEVGYVMRQIDPTEVRYIRLNFGVAEKNSGMCIAMFSALPNRWYGKTGDFLGDSLTEQEYFTDALENYFGIKVNNYGEGGTTISNRVASGYFASRVSDMSTDCDFVFVQGGTNDWGLSATLGNKTDTTPNTFYGGLYQMFEALRTRFPSKPIIITTITQRNWQGEGQSSGIDSNNNNNSIMEFNEAITYMAHRYGCIVIDGFGESGICVSNLSVYTSDNIHFNTTGGKRFFLPPDNLYSIHHLRTV